MVKSAASFRVYWFEHELERVPRLYLRASGSHSSDVISVDERQLVPNGDENLFDPDREIGRIF